MGPFRPSPVIPSGVFSAVSTIRINASPLTVYNAILDSHTWPDWNTFVPSVSISSHPDATTTSSGRLVSGTKMVFTVQMNKTFKTKSPEEVTTVSDPPKSSDPAGTKYIIQWESRGTPHFLLHAERVNELVSTDDPNVTEYTSWETFGGPVAWAVKWMSEGDLDARFNDWTRDLKAYCEKTSAQVGGATGGETYRDT